MTEQTKFLRTIKSFVKREGRMTDGQRRAYQQYWPIYGIEYQEQPINIGNMFQQTTNPIILEIGFGMGDSLFEMAVNNPNANFIGIEVFKTGIGALLTKLEKQPLNNLRVIHADACDVLKFMLQPQSLDGVQIFFPDPWHKKRHQKRRLIQIAFIELLLTRLKPDGFIHIATDWEDYAEHIKSVLSNFPTLHAKTTPNYLRPVTKYENRGKRLGHSVWDFIVAQTTSDSAMN